MHGAPAAVDWREVETCVLDMDGTLLDLYFDNQVWNHRLPLRVAERTGLSPEAARRHVRDTLTPQRGTLTWYCMEHWSEVFGLELSAIEDELSNLIRIRPGCEAFLDTLRSAGIRLILATNAHPQSLTRKLAATGIGRYFDFVVSAHQLGYAKEHAAFWSALTRHAAIRPAHTLFIDDNQAVLEAAQRFGIRYLFGIAQPDSGAGAISHDGFHSLEHFSELGYSGS